MKIQKDPANIVSWIGLWIFPEMQLYFAILKVCMCI